MLTRMRVRPAVMALAVLVALGRQLVAQGGRPLRVDGVRDLTFGTVLPGIPRQILRTDPTGSGEFQIRGERFSQFELTFALPSLMTGPAGAVMPVVFGGNDAGYSVAQSIASQVGFDPTQPFRSQLDRSGKGSVFLGGTANPLVNQRAGSYNGTVTLTVAYLP